MAEVMAGLSVALFVGGALGAFICGCFGWEDAQTGFLWAAGIGLALIFVMGRADDYERKNERIKARSEREYQERLSKQSTTPPGFILFSR